MTKTITYIIVLIVIVVGGFLLWQVGSKNTENIENTEGSENIEQESSTNTKLGLDDLDLGCFGQDCIPSIDDPKFESISQADEWLNDGDSVFGITYKGESRVYPQRILNWHEIVNDTIAGDPIVITFCPLCGSAIAFERKVDGKEVEFGVSGRLYNSNLVMYDRNKEQSYWQQASGEAIVGPAAERGEELAQVSISPTMWGTWKKEHPDTKVLSRDTGFRRDYGRYPYGTYEEDGEIYFGVQNTDDRLTLKEVVYGFNVDEKQKVYTLSALEKESEIEDSFANRNVSVRLEGDGEVVMTDNDTGETFFPLRTFWFAWAAFYPNTEIYK